MTDVVAARKVWMASGRRVCGYRDIPMLPTAQERAAKVIEIYCSRRPGLSTTSSLSQPDPRVKLWTASALLDASPITLVVALRYGSCWYVAEDSSLH